MNSDPQKEASNNKEENRQSENATSAKVELEIVRYRELLETLRQPQMIWRLLITCLFFVMVVFFGLAMVVMSVKKIYPYSTIETNVYGATTMGTEDKDVTYWLFNTAEMWGNSGINVDEGDVITVRSSGAWHTAIHHLVEQTEKNVEITDKFTGSEGRERRFANDVFRSQFRLVDDLTDGKLLMCIFPEENAKRTADVQAASKGFQEFTEKIYDHHIYEIGKERRDFRITEKGVLHFAVNDIPLTRTNIKKIYRAYIDSLLVAFPEQMRSHQQELEAWLKKWKDADTVPFDGKIRQLDNQITEEWKQRGRREYSFLFGSRPDADISLLNNELIYYFNNNFTDAWYVDNLGSLLIVVEKKKKS